jgi:hypothetical protein
MAEDLSQWVDYAADGTPKLKPGVGMLPPMNRTPPPGAARQGGKTDGTNATNGETNAGKVNNPKRKAAADRFATLNVFVDATMRDLTPSEKLVWFVLFRDVRDGVAKAAQSDIATRSGLTQSTVSLAIRRLVKRGLLRVVYQGGFRKGLSTYRIRGSV